MCGRYEFNILADSKGKQIKEQVKKLNLVFKEGEIFCGDKVLCVIPKESKIDLSVMKWGIQTKSLLINARSETLKDKPTFKRIMNRRCAVICNGFYEWDKNKNKFYINFKDKYMYLACIFNELNELVILTQEANDEDFKKIHNRIPIIMNQEEMINYVHGFGSKITNKDLFINNVKEDIKLFK